MYSELCRATAAKVSAFPYSTALLFISLPFLVTYLVTSVSSIITLYVQKGPRKPPIVPYWIPIIGHALSFVLSPKNLALSIRQRVRKTSFARLNFLGEDVHMVSGPDAIKAVFKSRYLESKPGIAIALSTLFGGPKECSWFYNADDSGIYDQPHPHSSVTPEHRIFYLTHKTIHDFFAGPGLASFCKRFQTGLNQQISESSLHDDWTELPDLFAFLRDIMSKAAIEATAGPQLLRINPNFIQDLWKFDNALPKLFRGLPAWLVPRSWAVRQKCLDTISEWRRYAESNFDESCIEQDGHDPYFGAPLMRWRNDYFNNIDPLTKAASDSEDFGLLWAENSTSVPAACWAVLELFQDPNLLREVREKIKACQSSSEQEDLEVEKLCSQPLLQSIFAEILRVRTSQFIVRADEHEDFHYGDWTVKKGKPVAIDTYAVHTDETVWSTGSSENYHGVKDFWAQRFLTYASNPMSGPLRKHQQPVSSIRKSSIIKDGSTEEPKFSTSSLTGAWIPFAGGRGQCPGRTFAKQEVILGFSIVCSLFDIELCVKSKPEPDLIGYGLGGLRPKQKIPFRIRRRSNL